MPELLLLLYTNMFTCFVVTWVKSVKKHSKHIDLQFPNFSMLILCMLKKPHISKWANKKTVCRHNKTTALLFIPIIISDAVDTLRAQITTGKSKEWMENPKCAKLRPKVDACCRRNKVPSTVYVTAHSVDVNIHIPNRAKIPIPSECCIT